MHKHGPVFAGRLDRGSELMRKSRFGNVPSNSRLRRESFKRRRILLGDDQNLGVWYLLVNAFRRLEQSGAGHGAQPTRLAQQVLPLGYAPREKDRQSGGGTEAGGTSLLDVASGNGLRPVARARSHAGEPGHPDGVQ